MINQNDLRKQKLKRQLKTQNNEHEKIFDVKSSVRPMKNPRRENMKKGRWIRNKERNIVMTKLQNDGRNIKINKKTNYEKKKH